jgi:hypothetical protein
VVTNIFQKTTGLLLEIENQSYFVGVSTASGQDQLFDLIFQAHYAYLVGVIVSAPAVRAVTSDLPITILHVSRTGSAD